MERRAEMIGRLLPPIGSRMGSIAAGGVSAVSWTGIGSSRVVSRGSGSIASWAAFLLGLECDLRS